MKFSDVLVSKDLEILPKESKCNSKRVRKTSQKVESRLKRSKDTLLNFLSCFLPPRFAFGIKFLHASNSPRLVAKPTSKFCLRLVLGFYPPQTPPGCLPSQPPALCLLLVLGFYPTQIPPVGCLPNPRAFFAFGFWVFTRPKSPGWVPSKPPALSLLSVFGLSPSKILPGCLPSQPTAIFLLSNFVFFTRPKSPQFD